MKKILSLFRKDQDGDKDNTLLNPTEPKLEESYLDIESNVKVEKYDTQKKHQIDDNVSRNIEIDVKKDDADLNSSVNNVQVNSLSAIAASEDASQQVVKEEQNKKPPQLAKLKVQLPNAKVGANYAEKVVAIDESGNQVNIQKIKFEGLAEFNFDPKDLIIKGSPRQAGSFPLRFEWKNINGDEQYFIMALEIIADPKSLWNKIEPPENAPYKKSHADSLYVNNQHAKIIAASRRGRSHEHSGSFRDDDFYVNSDVNSGWSVMVVADGAGSARFSRYGSKIAVTEFGKSLRSATESELGLQLVEKLKTWHKSDESKLYVSAYFQKLFQDASVLTLQEIEKEAKSVNAESKDYSTTLLAAATVKVDGFTFVISFWVGDGVIAAYGPKGKVRIMGKADSGEHAGQTVFLSSKVVMDGVNFFKRISMGFFEDISSVLLMTDGVSDPIFESDSSLTDPSKWDQLLNEIQPILVKTEPDKFLLDWLEFYSPKHHDDRTIVVLQ